MRCSERPAPFFILEPGVILRRTASFSSQASQSTMTSLGADTGQHSPGKEYVNQYCWFKQQPEGQLTREP
jgi:hypothetical protein